MGSQGLTFTITADTAEAAARLEEFFTRTSEGITEITGLGPLLEEIGGKIAAVFTVGAMVEFTKEAINTAEQMQKMAEKSGLALSTLSAMREEAHKLGEPIDLLNVSLGMFADKVFNAVRNGGQALQVFQDLGIRLVDTNGQMRSTDAILSDVAERFKNLPDGPMKATAAMDLFGRSGRELIPILNQGADGMARMKAEGGGVTPEMARDATDFNQSIRELQFAFEMLFMRVAQEILPSLQQLVNYMQRLSQETGGFKVVAEGLADVFKLLATVALGVGLGFEVLGEAIGTLAGVGFENFLDGIRTIMTVMELWVEEIKTVIKAFVDLGVQAVETSKVMALAVTGHWKAAAAAGKEMVTDALSDMAKISGAAVTTTAKAAGEISGYLERAAARAQGVFGDMFLGIGMRTIETAAAIKALFGATGGANGQAPGGAATGAAPQSEAAKKLLQEIDKAWQEATQGKIALMEEERKAQLDKVTKEVLDEEAAADAKLKINQTFDRKIQELQRNQAEAKMAIQLAEIQGRRALLQNDPDITEADKKSQFLVLLRAENDLLEKNIAITKRQAADEQATDEARLLAQKKLQELQLKHAETQQQISNTAASGTFGGEFRHVLTDLGNQWGTWAGQVASNFKTVFNNAISSISSGITGLIMGTKTWGQALMQIGTSILTSIVQAIVEMGVRWVLTHLMMAAAGKAIGASSVAANTPIALAQSAMWAAPAALATIASYGAAAAAAPAEVAASLGLIQAEALSGFAEGGFTGGIEGMPAGMVHGQEFVFSAPAVQRLGVGNLAALHNAGLNARGATGGKTGTLHVSVTDDRRAQDLERDPYFEGMVLRIMDRNRWKYS